MILGEVPTRRDIMATLLIVAGCAVAVSFASHKDHIYGPDELFALYTKPNFYLYFGAVVLVVAAWLLAIRWMERVQATRGSSSPEYRRVFRVHRFSYAAISGIAGAQSVLFAKTCVELITDAVAGGGAAFLKYVSTYAVLLAMAGTITLQIYWLNCGLARWDALYNVPIFSSFWILVSVIGGGVFYDEFAAFGALQALLFPVGVLLAIVGVYVLSQREGDGAGADAAADGDAAWGRLPLLGADAALAARARATIRTEEVVCRGRHLGLGLVRLAVRLVDVSSPRRSRVAQLWALVSASDAADPSVLRGGVRPGDVLVSVNGESLLDRWVSHTDAMRRLTHMGRPLRLGFRVLSDRQRARALSGGLTSLSAAAAPRPLRSSSVAAPPPSSSSVTNHADVALSGAAPPSASLPRPSLAPRPPAPRPRSGTASAVMRTGDEEAVAAEVAGIGVLLASRAGDDDAGDDDARWEAADERAPLIVAPAPGPAGAAGPGRARRHGASTSSSGLPGSRQASRDGGKGGGKASRRRHGARGDSSGSYGTAARPLPRAARAPSQPWAGRDEEGGWEEDEGEDEGPDTGILDGWGRGAGFDDASSVGGGSSAASASQPLVAPPRSVASSSFQAAGATAPRGSPPRGRSRAGTDLLRPSESGGRHTIAMYVDDASSAVSPAQRIRTAHHALRGAVMDPMMGVFHMGGLVGPTAIFARDGAGDDEDAPAEHPLAALIDRVFPHEGGQWSRLDRLLDTIGGGEAAAAGRAGLGAAWAGSSRRRVQGPSAGPGAPAMASASASTVGPLAASSPRAGRDGTRDAASLWLEAALFAAGAVQGPPGTPPAAGRALSPAAAGTPVALAEAGTPLGVELSAMPGRPARARRGSHGDDSTPWQRPAGESWAGRELRDAKAAAGPAPVRRKPASQPARRIAAAGNSARERALSAGFGLEAPALRSLLAASTGHAV